MNIKRLSSTQGTLIVFLKEFNCYEVWHDGFLVAARILALDDAKIMAKSIEKYNK